MIPEHLEALALADVAGALDVGEQQRLRAEIAKLPTPVRDECARLYDATLTLAAAVSGPRPSRAVRERLLASLRPPARGA